MPNIVLHFLTLLLTLTGGYERRSAVLTHVYVLDVTLAKNASSTLAGEIEAKYQRNIIPPAGTAVRVSGTTDPEAACEQNIPCDIISITGRAPEDNQNILKVDLLIVSHPSRNEHPDSKRSKLCQVDAVSDAEWRACTIAKVNLRSTTTKIQEHIQWHLSHAQ